MHRGYIKIWRKVMESFLWKDSDAYKLFSYLLMKANHKDTAFIFNGKKQMLKRGQMICGRTQLADATHISESKIYRTMKILENEHLITQQKTNRYTVVSIVNYEEHQSNEQESEQPETDKVNIPVNIPVNTSKELIRTKKNVYIAHPTSEIRNYFYEQYEQTFGEKYVANFQKEGKIFKDLTQVVDMNRLKELILSFFESQDDFIKQAGYTVGVFKSQINKLKSPSTQQDEILRKAGLKHE